MKTDDKIINHMRNVKLLQAIHLHKRFFIECSSTDEGAMFFPTILPNAAFAIKEIELPNFDLYEEKLGYTWVKKSDNEDAGLYDEIERLKLLACKQFEELYIEMNPYAYNSAIQKELEKFKKQNNL